MPLPFGNKCPYCKSRNTTVDKINGALLCNKCGRGSQLSKGIFSRATSRFSRNKQDTGDEGGGTSGGGQNQKPRRSYTGSGLSSVGIIMIAAALILHFWIGFPGPNTVSQFLV